MEETAAVTLSEDAVMRPFYDEMEKVVGLRMRTHCVTLQDVGHTARSPYSSRKGNCEELPY
jgi:hypothetical protein